MGHPFLYFVASLVGVLVSKSVFDVALTRRKCDKRHSGGYLTLTVIAVIGLLVSVAFLGISARAMYEIRW